MATVQITHTWADGSQVHVAIRAKVNNAAAMSSLRLDARKTFDEVLDKLGVEVVEVEGDGA